MQFLFFMGRFHVVVLHLPITLVLVLALLEWLDRGGRRGLRPALNVLWPLTALAALLTVALGAMHFAEGGFSGPSANAHRALGTSVALIAVAAWWLRSNRAGLFARVRAALLAVLVLLVTVTGHFGGNLTHGEGYLTDQAPGFVRALAGLAPRRATPTSVAAADAYADVIAPIVQSRCIECHGGGKVKGGLDLTSYATLRKGGKDGPALVPGKAEGSELVRRISLAPNDDDFMPNGKAPLAAAQVSLLRWWIDAGAVNSASVASLNAPADIQALIAAELHIGAGGTAAVAVASAPPVSLSLAADVVGPEQKVDPKLLATLEANGLMGRQLSLSIPALSVSPIVPGVALSAAQLAALGALPPAQIVELDLREGAVGDAAATAVGHLTALRKLRLDNNSLTDRAIGELAGLRDLELLGLYGNAGITDKSVDALLRLPALRRVYLWRTGVTPAGIARLRQARPTLQVEGAEELKAAVIDAGNPAAAPGSRP